MIVTLTDTTSAKVESRLVDVREKGGAVALGRVLTLVILPDDRQGAERAIRTANGASYEHPMRVIVAMPDGEGEAGLDAEIRVGADAGASEVVVLQPRGGAGSSAASLVTAMLLPDAPIVTWWPQSPPGNPGEDLMGSLSQRRITEAARCADPLRALANLAHGYTPGDTDLSWSSLTLWRALLAAALDESDNIAVDSVRVTGDAGLPAASLLSGWLQVSLDCPVELSDDASGALTEVRMDTAAGPIVLHRPNGSTVATLSRPGRTDQKVSLPRRDNEVALIEELRRLDPDEIYGRVLTQTVTSR